MLTRFILTSQINLFVLPHKSLAFFEVLSQFTCDDVVSEFRGVLFKLDTLYMCDV